MKTPVEVISKNDNNIFMERETGITHSEFSREYSLFCAIRSGNVALVKKKSKDYLTRGITMGNLSDNSIRQLKYWAVSSIAVAIHYAILGGLDETDAFNLSDEYIRHIDSLSNINDMLSYLSEKATDLTYAVYNSKAGKASSPAIRYALHFIHIHLNEKIRIKDLAKECLLSESYLSTLFKRELGVSIHEYILKEKLNAATIMLSDGASLSEIAYNLSFCSETHFISSYKKVYGTTPHKGRLNYQSEPQSLPPESQSDPESQS